MKKWIKYWRWMAAVLLMPLCASAYTDPNRPIPHWQLVPGKSTISWAIKYSGQTIHGTFPDFIADITYDERRDKFGRAYVKISTVKVLSDDKDAQDYLPTSEWLGADDYPFAIFETTQMDIFKHLQGDQYSLQGDLILHGFKGHITIPFTMHLAVDKETWTPTHYAIVDGQTSLRRLDYKIGQGDWTRTDALANDVTISFHLEAKQVVQPPQ